MLVAEIDAYGSTGMGFDTCGLVLTTEIDAYGSTEIGASYGEIMRERERERERERDSPGPFDLRDEKIKSIYNNNM